MLELGLILAVGLALIHAFLSKFNIEAIIPEYRWLSFAGGVSISYVFLEIFPELSHAQETLENVAIPLVAYLENHVYILALLGLIIFYGLDVFVLNHAKSFASSNSPQKSTFSAIFWLHIGGFALLNVIFGYLLQDLAEHSLIECILFFIAVGLHFFIIDYGLREHHEKVYDQKGRWLLTGSILVGAILGQARVINEAGILMVWSFLAGSLILNVLKRELPEEKKTCFWSFCTGSIVFATLFLSST